MPVARPTAEQMTDIAEGLGMSFSPERLGEGEPVLKALGHNQTRGGWSDLGTRISLPTWQKLWIALRHMA